MPQRLQKAGTEFELDMNLKVEVALYWMKYEVHIGIGLDV